MGIVRTVLTGLLSAVTAVAIAYSLFGVGFALCTTPQATAFIGGTFAGWESSTFPENDMAAIAESARSFAIDGTSSEELYDTIYDAIEETRPDLTAALAQGESQTGQTALGQAVERYTLPNDALSHLRDCLPIFTTGRISVGVVAGFGLAGLVAIGILSGRRRVGGTLVAGSLLVICALVALGAWAVADFDGLFTWMHGLLFAQGTWIFDSKSLLIQLFPEAFWAAMAGLWVLTSLACSLVVGLVGKLLAK